MTGCPAFASLTCGSAAMSGSTPATTTSSVPAVQVASASGRTRLIGAPVGAWPARAVVSTVRAALRAPTRPARPHGAGGQRGRQGWLGGQAGPVDVVGQSVAQAVRGRDALVQARKPVGGRAQLGGAPGALPQRHVEAALFQGRPDVFDGQPGAQQLPDVRGAHAVQRAVHAVPVGGTLRGEQALLFVIAQRAGVTPVRRASSPMRVSFSPTMRGRQKVGVVVSVKLNPQGHLVASRAAPVAGRRSHFRTG